VGAASKSKGECGVMASILNDDGSIAATQDAQKIDVSKLEADVDVIDDEVASDESSKTSNETMRLKDLGNASFKAGDMSASIQYYTQAIALDPSNHILYANRAMAYVGLLEWSAVIDDCKTALSYNDKYSKSYYRLIKALMATNKLREARQYLLIAFQKCKEDTSSHKNFLVLERDLNDVYPSPLRPKPGDFDIVDELGDGNFSKIYLAKLKTDKERVFAIKVIETMTGKQSNSLLFLSISFLFPFL